METFALNLPLAVLYFGLALSLASWLWFRHPGQKLWFAGPVWRASRYLRPTGVKLWVAGTVISFGGLVWLLLVELSVGGGS
jgi:hypothetical protein